jgi:DNA-binding CsgD family transcriptional regulator
MKRVLEREPLTSADADVETVVRVVLMTADGGSIDITDAAGDLLVLARTVAHVPSDGGAPNAACPASWAALCRHLGRCDGRCSAPQGAMSSATAAGALDAHGKLTGRESQVVAHVRQGFTNKEIARRLGIQEDTVKKHLQAVFSKLGVRRRALLTLSSGAMQMSNSS